MDIVNIVARIIGSLVLVGIMGFCVFGFLASYELPEPSQRLPWQAGYGGIGLACLLGIAFLWRPRR